MKSAHGAAAMPPNITHGGDTEESRCHNTPHKVKMPQNSRQGPQKRQAMPMTKRKSLDISMPYARGPDLSGPLLWASR